MFLDSKNDYQIAYAGNAHDISMVIGNSFNVISEKPNATQVIEKLKSVTNHKGVGGSFGFIENEKDGPHFHFPVQLKKIVDGRIETVE